MMLPSDQIDKSITLTGEQVTKIRKALEFYADTDNWSYNDGYDGYNLHPRWEFGHYCHEDHQKTKDLCLYNKATEALECLNNVKPYE